VAGRVDNVDLHAVVTDSRGFGQDGDSPLALQFIRVHDALDDLFIGPEYPALPQHRIHQRRLSVVNVRDDGYVSGGGVRHNNSS
jgi:hypothetical protein